MLIAGTISFVRNPESGRRAESIAQASTAFDHLTATKLYDAHGVTLFAIEREHDVTGALRVDSSHSGRTSWLLGDCCYAQPGCAPADPKIFERTLAPAVKLGRWTSVQVSHGSGTLRIRTDSLGIQWLYLAAIPGGFAFAHDFSALVKNLPMTKTIDYESVLLELTLTYLPDERTIIREIELVPPGALVELGPEGLKVLERETPSYGDELAGTSEARKFEILDEIYDSITRTYVRSFDPALVLSMSAGFDSRYALAFLERHALEAELCTFGNPKSLEVVNARAISERVGRHTAVFGCEDNDWNQWMRSTTFLGTTGLIQWNGWAEDWFRFERRVGNASLIGFLGDALTGKHLGKHASADWLDYWTTWSTAGGWASSAALKSEMRDHYREAIVERLASSIGDATFGFPHQRALHFDLYGRQRRRVASQTNLMARFLTPVVFFYDRALFRFWGNVSYDDLREQRLYLRYAESRFPRLFHPNERQGPPPPSLLERMTGRIARLGGRNVRSRPPVVDHWRLLSRQRERILDLSRRVEPLVEPMIDVNAFRQALQGPATAHEISSHDIIRAVNLFQLLDTSFGSA